MKTLLIIGARSKCFKAAKRLGYKVFLWTDGDATRGQRLVVDDCLEVPYSKCSVHLPEALVELFKQMEIDQVIGCSEETVLLAAMVREKLKLSGADVSTSDLFHNKFLMKERLRKIGIPITKYRLINDQVTVEDLIFELGLPTVLKPIDESGAQNIVVCRTELELRENFKLGLLAEAYVDGPEVSIETFVENGKPIFHNVTNYLHQWKKSILPANLHFQIEEELIRKNDLVIANFGLQSGMTHSEFYLSKNGPVFGEIAMRPPGGYYMDLISNVYGFDSWETYIKLCNGQKVGSLNQENKGYGIVIMLHPGEGRLMSIEGTENAMSLIRHPIEFNIRRKAGDVINKHNNTSNEVGHILFLEPTESEALKTIDMIEQVLDFRMQASFFTPKKSGTRRLQ